MAEGGQQPSSFPESSNQLLSDRPSDSNHNASPAVHPFQVDQRNMEFAPLPSNHFGQLGLAHSPFDMRHMSSTLPDYSARYHQSPHQPQMAQIPGADPQYAYPPYQTQPFANQLSNQHQSQYPQTLASQYKGITAYSTNTTANHTDFHVPRGLVYPQQQSFYTSGMSQQSHYPGFPGQPHTPYGLPAATPYQARNIGGYVLPRVQVENPQIASLPQGYNQGAPALRRNSSSSSLPASSALRGPPRKPKQSGHALWVGNLPPGTQITDLKDHFSRDATEDIESVFLISKSNCAFVNYRTEETCAAAMARFHDSRFRGVRLVCRLRRGSNTPVSPATASVEPEHRPGAATAGALEDALHDTSAPAPSFEIPPVTTPRSSPGKLAKEKFFIVKSLTVEDLERSVISGIWATQAHNEENLNVAYETAENVYLIFSANKSGEYFGYARMESPINADAVSEQEMDKPVFKVQNAQPNSAANVPVTIPTPATSTAPRGHIVDDSARGTIFWEADSGPSTPGSALDGVSGDAGETSGDDSVQKSSMPQSTTFGKPFRISWQSTERLPFYRTRGLRNPWNANREVKIARDGTELEPMTGRKLVGMFEQQAQINAAARGSSPHYVGYAQQMPQYFGGGMAPQMPYGYGPPGANQPYGRPY